LFKLLKQARPRDTGIILISNYRVDVGAQIRTALQQKESAANRDFAFDQICASRFTECFFVTR
jgi:hypothetical protein